MSDRKAGFDIYGDVNVLNKGQVVIPKEVRDRFGIRIGSKLSVLVRGNFIHLVKKEDVLPLLNMPKFSLVSDPQEGVTPIGMLESGEMFGLSAQDRVGNMYILGNPGCGKSVNLINIIVSDILNRKGGLFIDPFGDLIKEITNYIPNDLKANVLEFSGDGEDLQKNIERFDREIDLSGFLSDQNKMLLLNLDYRKLGSDTARGFGMHLLKRFFSESADGLRGRCLYVDEAHNFIDDAILSNLEQSGARGLSATLLDQTLDHYSLSTAHRLFNAVNHLICYKTSSMTSKFLIDTFNLEIPENHLKDMDQYHFYTALTVDHEMRSEKRARGIFPISYPKQG